MNGETQFAVKAIIKIPYTTSIYKRGVKYR